MNSEQQEALLAEKLKEFTDKMAEVAKDVISDIYCDYLPHVMTDTECNVSIQTEDALESIISGKFIVEDNYIVVNDRLRVGLSSPYSYDQIATSIYNAVPDKIENLTIKELQAKVNQLTAQLQEAYRRY